MSAAKIIIRKVSERTGIPVDRMLSKTRTYEIAHARQRAMFSLRKARVGPFSRQRSTTEVAAIFGRDHTTVLWAEKMEAFRRGLGPDPRPAHRALKAKRAARRTQTEAGE